MAPLPNAPPVASPPIALAPPPISTTSNGAKAERISEDLTTSLAGNSVVKKRNQVGVGGGLGVDPNLEYNNSLPLVAICGRPNVGKSTLFNRLTGTRRSIVGDEPGITRDRIYGEVEWSGRDVRLVDTGGVVPDDEALIPSEIFRQAQVALEEADAIVMVVDGRTELASPDLELARLLLRGGKPCFLAVNKMDTAELLPSAENFRRLGFKNVLPISAEHGSGIGDLLDEVFDVLPAALELEPERMLTIEDEEEEDEDGPVDAPVDPRADPQAGDDEDGNEETESAPRPRKLRTHGDFVQTETKIAIIGRPNVGKSTPCSTPSPAPTAPSSPPSPAPPATPSTRSSSAAATASASSTPPAFAARARPSSWPRSSPSSWRASTSKPPTSACS